MPRREASIEVDASPQALWRLLRDFEALCSCIPGVERVEVHDARSATLTVREKVGVVPLVVVLDARIEREDAPRSLHAVARGEHLTMAIDVALERGAARTLLHTVFDVTGSGPLKAIVDNLFERRATERTAAFSAALGERFGSGKAAEAERHAGPSQSAPAAPSAPAAAIAPGWFAALVRWIRSRLGRPAP